MGPEEIAGHCRAAVAAFALLGTPPRSEESRVCAVEPDRGSCRAARGVLICVAPDSPADVAVSASRASAAYGSAVIWRELRATAVGATQVVACCTALRWRWPGPGSSSLPRSCCPRNGPRVLAASGWPGRESARSECRGWYAGSGRRSALPSTSAWCRLSRATSGSLWLLCLSYRLWAFARVFLVCRAPSSVAAATRPSQSAWQWDSLASGAPDRWPAVGLGAFPR